MNDDQFKGTAALSIIAGAAAWWLFTFKSGLFITILTFSLIMYSYKKTEKNYITHLKGKLIKGENYWLKIEDFNEKNFDLKSNAGSYNDMFNFEAVGESNYQIALTALMPEEAKTENKHRAYFTSSLIIENNNPYDKNAIAIEILGAKVGYIPKNENKAVKKLLNSIDSNRTSFSCPACIIGGNDKNYGVWLDV